MAFMRKSKFRHVFGTALKRDQCYDGIRVTRTSWESTYCCANPKFVAIITEAAGGGSFLTLPLEKVGRVNIDNPMVAGHKGAVLDIAWCPHNDNVIASASEDCSIKVWQIPDGGLTENLTEAIVDLQVHQRRVTLIVWHPSAQNVLLSTSSDNTIILWNVGVGEAMLQIEMPDQIYSGYFNFDGSKFACTCKDKHLRVLDTHSGEVLAEKQIHLGSKPSQCVYLKNGQIFTTGFSRMSERQYGLWNESNLEEVVTENIDNSNGVNFIFYDPDTSMIYLAGKGDSVIRYYEVTDEAPYVHYLSTYSSKQPQRGIGFMPKRALNVNTNECARFYKLHNQGLCEVISFTVPRKSELFQDDLYPDTASDTPAISADEFFSGKNAAPILMTLKSETANQPKTVRKSNILDKMPSKPVASQQKQPQQTSNNADSTPSSAPAPAAAPAAALPPSSPPAAAVSENGEELKALKELVAQLEKTVRKQDTRIQVLEVKVKALEAATDDEADQDDA